MSSGKSIRIASGMVLVALGTIGIALPLLPTTPFLLLATYLFARSSRRWHDWLLGHKHLGPYVHAFRDKTGLTPTQKLRIGISITIIMGASCYWVPVFAVQCVLAGMWCFWMVVLLRIKTITAVMQKQAKARTAPDRAS